MQLNQILLTTDFSDNARGVYQCAANLAANFHANLHLVHFAGAIPSLIPSASRESLFGILDQALSQETTGHPALKDIEVQRRLERHRWTRSRQRALEQDLGIDLIVMASQGRTGIARMLLGSFADRVIRHSSVPVLLFRTTENVEMFNPRTVLVPHDFYDRPSAVLPMMRWLGKHFQSSFRFLHVYDPSWTESQSISGMEQQFAMALKSSQTPSVEERFAKLVSEELSGLDVTLETAQGFPSQQAVHRAHQLKADLVLLEKLDGLGGVARAVTRDAKCSVLTVPIIDMDN